MYTLGIETSCDETSCAILKNRKVSSNITISSLKEHKKYGGVVPEIATRAHLKCIDKVLAAAIKQYGRRVEGPLSSDTLFIPSRIKQFDCIICAYHDQAMIPFKLLAFNDGVNLTIGLPIVRTSPAHGTAFDLMSAGKTPQTDSMIAAIKLARKLKV